MSFSFLNRRIHVLNVLQYIRMLYEYFTVWSQKPYKLGSVDQYSFIKSMTEGRPKQHKI